MTLSPLLTAPPLIQLHVAAAALSVALTALIFARPRGRWLHRRLGWGWVGAMAVLAGSGLGILPDGLIGPFANLRQGPSALAS